MTPRRRSSAPREPSIRRWRSGSGCSPPPAGAACGHSPRWRGRLRKPSAADLVDDVSRRARIDAVRAEVAVGQGRFDDAALLAGLPWKSRKSVKIASWRLQRRSWSAGASQGAARVPDATFDRVREASGVSMPCSMERSSLVVLWEFEPPQAILAAREQRHERRRACCGRPSRQLPLAWQAHVTDEHRPDRACGQPLHRSGEETSIAHPAWCRNCRARGPPPPTTATGSGWSGSCASPTVMQTSLWSVAWPRPSISTETSPPRWNSTRADDGWRRRWPVPNVDLGPVRGPRRRRGRTAGVMNSTNTSARTT